MLDSIAVIKARVAQKRAEVGQLKKRISNMGKEVHQRNFQTAFPSGVGRFEITLAPSRIQIALENFFLKCK